MDRGALVYNWLLNRIRSIAVAVGLLGSVCALGVTILAIAIMLVASLVPLYLHDNSEKALGEYYCINNYTLTVGFQIPQYTTTFSVTVPTYTFSMFQTSATGSITGYGCTNCCAAPACSGTCATCTASASASCSACGAFGTCTATCSTFCCITPASAYFTVTNDVTVSETCTYTAISIISPSVPNAKVFNSYALGEACYQTLQSCYYDPLLSACLLSNCVVDSLISPSTTLLYSLTNYTLRCTANIYYKTRCADSGASSRLYYSSSQQNSACREQRLTRINSCLNSTTQLANVPCLTSVSTGTTTASGTCTETASPSSYQVSVTPPTATTITLPAPSTQVTPTLNVIFATMQFSSSDQTNGHPYRISNVNSQSFNSSQPGALYCGTITDTQLAATITALINSQTTG